MKDIGESIADLGYGNQWDAVKEQVAQAPRKWEPAPSKPCTTPGCNSIVSASETYCSNCRDLRMKVEHDVDTIPMRYRWCGFTAPELSERCGGEGVLRRARAAFDALASKKASSVVLQGSAGSGKTVLAVAMLRAWHERVPGKFIDAIRLGQSQRYEKLGDEPRIVTDAKRTPLAVIDDIGGEASWGNEMVAEVIRSRHADERRTVYTTGFDLEALSKMYGAGVARRIFDQAIVLTWPAERKAAA